MAPKRIPAKLLARPDGSTEWNAGKLQSELDQFQQVRDRVFHDWTSVAAIEAQFDELFPLGYNIEIRALSILRWHGSEALSTIEFLLSSYPRNERILGLCSRMLKAIHTDAAVDRLLASLPAAPMRDVVIEHARRWPIYMLQKMLALNPNRGSPAADLVQRLLHEHPAWLEPLRLSATDEHGQTLSRLLHVEVVPEATPDMLPALLQSPPWRNPPAQSVVPDLGLEPIREPARFHRERLGSIGDRFASSMSEVESYFSGARELPADAARWSAIEKVLWLIGLAPAAFDAAMSGRPLRADAFEPARSVYFNLSRHIYHLPPTVASHLLLHIPAERLAHLQAYEVRPMLHWLGDSLQADCVLRLLPRISRYNWSVHHCLDSDRFALDVAHASRNRWQRQDALQWIGAYPHSVARGLIPIALGPAGTARDVARHALREMDEAGLGDAVRASAERYGAAARSAVDAVLRVAPGDVLPHTMPSVPKPLVLTSLPRLLLRGTDRAIPHANLPDVLIALALSKPEAPYEGLLQLQQAVDAESLARFGRALLDWWQDNKATSKDRWMFTVQGLIGNDETVRLLTRSLRQWRASLNRVRAYEAMEMLAQIGSDTALTQLHSLASQTRYRDLRDRAERMIDEIAEQRSLSRDELEDRTVPDLGLDVDGTLALDFGRRRFIVRFDESLAPYVCDETGKRLKDLPKPRADDEPAIAKAAVQRYKDLKKNAKNVVGLQVRRLELAMNTGRRWTDNDFRSLLLPHPLLRHPIQRLLWGAYRDDGTLTGAFRVAEDLSFADDRDVAYATAPDALIGVVHPIDVPDEQLRRFAAIYSDYEILQPFRQLDREIYGLAPDHAESTELGEWHGRKVTVASLLGLENRGWNRSVGDGGIIDQLVKPLGGGLAMAIDIDGDEGWFVGQPAEGTLVQRIRRVGLTGEQRWAALGTSHLGQLNRIQASEVQRDLHLMAWFEE